MGRRRSSTLVVAVALAAAAIATGTTAAAGAPAKGGAAFSAPTHGYVLYWDQNEEEDYYASATNTQGQLITPWDPNGQMCPLNDGTGRFVVGYNPTQPSQNNPGGPPAHSYKQPPIGEELVNRTGVWTGQNLFVPGPYQLTRNGPGGDVPPVNGVYNSQSTFTGCAVDTKHNVFGNDIGTAQGDFPVPTSGRLVEWFAPSYRQACVVDGPDTGGLGPHHVGGTDGLAQPGMMSTLPNGDLLLPEAGSPTGGIPGRVLEYDHASLPQRASDCPGGVYPRTKLHTSVFFQGSGDTLPVPSGIARDPTCGCYAIDTIFGSPSIVWVDARGQLLNRPTVPGETIDQFGRDPNGYNPFGMAFAPDGTLYFVDIHIQCRGAGLSQCGPQSGHGQVMRVTFTGGQPATPQVIATGFDFPTSATICVIGKGQPCPFPTHRTPPPRPANGSTAG